MLSVLALMPASLAVSSAAWAAPAAASIGSPASIPMVGFRFEGGGFDPLSLSFGSNTFWTLVIFLLALPVMWKMVWGPMAHALEERDKKAEEAVHAAEAAKAAAEKAQSEMERRLAEAQKQLAKEIADARAMGERQGQEALAQAQQQAQQLLERAKAEIERERIKALSEIRETVVELSLDAATRVVGRSVGDDDQRRFVRDFVASASGGGR